ncbi:MAG: YceI family protein [Thermodesulfovibrionales bacterium]
MDTWSIDSSTSCAEFDLRYLLFAHLHGQFIGITGSASLDPDAPLRSYVEASIDAASATTGDALRDTQLRGPHFLDTARYPSIVFASTALELAENNRARITGDLTIRGITRQAVLDAHYEGPEEDPEADRLTLHLTASTTIDRNDFGITLEEAKELGSLLVGREIRITLRVRLVSSFAASEISARRPESP